MAQPKDKGTEPEAPGEKPAKISLPPFGLAQEILRQMAKPDRPAPAPAPAPVGEAPAAPAPYRGRDSLLQFADAVMTVAGEKAAAPVEAEHHLVTFFLDNEEY